MTAEERSDNTEMRLFTAPSRIHFRLMRNYHILTQTVGPGVLRIAQYGVRFFFVCFGFKGLMGCWSSDAILHIGDLRLA